MRRNPGSPRSVFGYITRGAEKSSKCLYRRSFPLLFATLILFVYIFDVLGGTEESTSIFEAVFSGVLQPEPDSGGAFPLCVVITAQSWTV